jgi:Fe2+ transport system protein FeoA
MRPEVTDISSSTAAQLTCGQKAKITSIKEGAFSLKLAEMGCVPGTEITRVFSAAGGSPIAYQIDSYLLGLRAEEASLLEVAPCEN